MASCKQVRGYWYVFSCRKYAMQKTFVAVNDWCHTLLRELTRRTPLVPTHLDNGSERVLYQVHPELLPENYFSLVACHTLDGLPLEQLRLGCWRVRENSKPAVLKAAGGFDATRLDRRCWGDLRLKPPGGRASLVSGELLVFGTGMLRGESPAGRHGVLSLPSGKVFTRIWALRREGSAGQGKLRKRIYESTNLIYGDALGELEQLWNRRADTDFLEHVVQALADASVWGRLPAALHSPLNATEVVRMHRRAQPLWNAPPRTARALLRRLDFILENTTLKVPAPNATSAVAFPRSRIPSPPSLDFRRDDLGLDGLFSGNAALN